MANLKDIAYKHNVNLNLKETPSLSPFTSVDNKKLEGKIRRAWISENDTNEKDLEQGLNHVETGFNGDSNRSHSPHLETGSKQGLNKFKDLRGNPIKVMVSLIKNISTEEPYITEKISVTDIAKSSMLTRESVKTALKFLLKNKAIIRLNSHSGLHGWARYKLNKTLANDFIKQG